MVLVRVLIGAVWLNGGLEKLLNPSFPGQFAASLQAGGFVSQAPPFFQDFMKGYVVPNAELFAQFMRVGEAMVGIALVLGLLTNLAAIGSVGLSAVILHPALLDEAAGLVGPNRTLVSRMGLQPHAPKVAHPKRVVKQQPHGFTPVAASPVFLVADSDAKFTVAGSHFAVENGAPPHAPAGGLGNENGFF